MVRKLRSQGKKSGSQLRELLKGRIQSRYKGLDVVRYAGMEPSEGVGYMFKGDERQLMYAQSLDSDMVILVGDPTRRTKEEATKDRVVVWEDVMLDKVPIGTVEVRWIFEENRTVLKVKRK